MGKETPFLGTAYTARSKQLASQRCINLYLEAVETKTGYAPFAFFGTPGLDLLATCDGGPIRGMCAIEGTLYVVSGTGVYAVNTNFNVSKIGTIATGSGQVSMIDNGNQAAIFDGQAGYSIVNGAVSPIALPFANPGVAVYQDGFGLVNQIGTEQFWQSNLGDLTTWNALNFSSEDGQTTNIMGLGELHRQVYVFKERGAFVWVNAGLSGFAFQRLDGVSIDVGCIAPNSIAKAGDNLLWLGQNGEGQGVIYKVNGYQPERVSTHAIEWAIAHYPTITDAIAYSYQQEGHTFYQITFPSGNETWTLDLTTSHYLGVPAWHQRAYFSNGNFSRHPTSCCQFFAGKVVVGDYESGNLYAYDLDTYTDNGNPRKWLRSWRAHAESTEVAQRVNWLEISAETGINVGVANPQMVLRQSFDAFEWTQERFQPVGNLGNTAQRIKFNRLGLERRGLGTDRIFELSSTDPFKVALFAARTG